MFKKRWIPSPLNKWTILSYLHHRNIPAADAHDLIQVCRTALWSIPTRNSRWWPFGCDMLSRGVLAVMPLFTRRLPLPARILSSSHLFTTSVRTISTNLQRTNLRRSYLYVPASSDRMLEKSITSGSDVIIYDLEDSVSPLNSGKANARRRLKKFLVVRTCILSSYLKIERDIGLKHFIRTNNNAWSQWMLLLEWMISPPHIFKMIFRK